MESVYCTVRKLI
jgi:hypothetical protein